MNKEEKNTMKRIIASILLIVIMLTGAVATLTGCGGNGPAAEFVMPEGGYDGSEVTVTFYHEFGKERLAILEAAISDFNAIYPDITIKAVKYDNYDVIRDKIKKEITVGGGPNLAICYADHVANYNISGAVQTLDVLMNSTIETPAGEKIGYTEEQLADFIPAYFNEGKNFGDGLMYTLPISKSTEVLYYNKTFFEKHNLTVPTTWEEMEAVCRQIKEIEPDSIPLGYDSEANLFITLCEQYASEGAAYTSATGEHFLFDNDTNKQFMEMFRGWYQEKLMTTKELSGGYTSSLFTGEGENVTTRCYMCIGSTGGATYQQPGYTTDNETGEIVFDFEVGITAMPQYDAENPKVILQGPSVCIFKNNNPQVVLASWLFAKFLTTDKIFQASISMNNGYSPVIKSVDTLEAYTDFLNSASTENIQALAVKATLDQTETFYSSPAFFGSSDARDQVGYLVMECLSSDLEGKTVKEKFDEIFATKVRACKTAIGQR